MARKTDKKDPIAHLGELIHGIKVAMMTTVEADGSLRSRPMWTHDTDFDGKLWFFTREHSPKVDEVERDHHVSLAYADPTRDRYVSVSGMARLVLDKDKTSVWIENTKKRFDLRQVPVEENLPLIYNELGVYEGIRLGTPCDDQ